MFKNAICFILTVILTCHLFPNDTFATQHALVVGINQYPNQPLQGAVNDAQLIADALRRIQVQLPEERLLLDAKATRANIISAWQEMVKQAQPGDTLIFTYAGHGSQQPDTPPLDEMEDHLDETLVVVDSYITDDELIDLFMQVPKSIQILFVADACHSGGIMTRSLLAVQRGAICRNLTKRTAVVPPFPPIWEISTGGDEQETPSNLTRISATDSPKVQICEVSIDNQPHGALSWSFAQAMEEGEADKNEDRRLERIELEEYLLEQVGNWTNGLYMPKLFPEGDSQPVITLRESATDTSSVTPVNSTLTDIAIKIDHGSLPEGLQHVHQVHDENFDLHVVFRGDRVEVFNRTRDKVKVVTTLTGQSSTATWQKLIDKERLLRTLFAHYDSHLGTVRIELKQGQDLHKVGELLEFSIAPSNLQKGLKYLTLFNLAGDGTLQWLYPSPEKSHRLEIDKFPHRRKERVQEPVGGDDLVAILCTQPPLQLQELLRKTSPSLPDPREVLDRLQQQPCQVGKYALFTCDDKEFPCR